MNNFIVKEESHTTSLNNLSAYNALNNTNELREFKEKGIVFNKRGNKEYIISNLEYQDRNCVNCDNSQHSPLQNKIAEMKDKLYNVIKYQDEKLLSNIVDCNEVINCDNNISLGALNILYPILANQSMKTYEQEVEYRTKVRLFNDSISVYDYCFSSSEKPNNIKTLDVEDYLTVEENYNFQYMPTTGFLVKRNNNLFVPLDKHKLLNSLTTLPGSQPQSNENTIRDLIFDARLVQNYMDSYTVSYNTFQMEALKGLHGINQLQTIIDNTVAKYKQKFYFLQLLEFFNNDKQKKFFNFERYSISASSQNCPVLEMLGLVKNGTFANNLMSISKSGVKEEIEQFANGLRAWACYSHGNNHIKEPVLVIPQEVFNRWNIAWIATSTNMAAFINAGGYKSFLEYIVRQTNIRVIPANFFKGVETGSTQNNSDPQFTQLQKPFISDKDNYDDIVEMFALYDKSIFYTIKTQNFSQVAPANTANGVDFNMVFSGQYTLPFTPFSSCDDDVTELPAHLFINYQNALPVALRSGFNKGTQINKNNKQEETTTNTSTKSK